LDDVPQSVREAMLIHLARDVREVLEHALEPKAVGLPEAA
jgi:ATP-dependent Lon protease